jgi:geranylgeranyl pyrophosphate synthase
MIPIQLIPYKEAIISILDIIDFTKDKEAFAEQILVQCSMQTMVKVVETLPEDKREALTTKFKEHPNDVEKLNEVLLEFVTKEEVQKIMEEVVQQAITEWMQAIASSLSDAQKQQLQQLSTSLQNSS